MTSSAAMSEKRGRSGEGQCDSPAPKLAKVHPEIAASPRVHAEQDNKKQQRPFTVVLTGGPCSGKSSVLAVLKRRLSVRGFQVLTVPENATHLLANSDGFQPEWAGTQAQIEMQRIFLDFQLDQESAFHQFAKLNPKPAVLLLDRSPLDCKVFLEDEQWVKVLDHPTKPRINEEELFKRYDLVLHMITCAEGNEGMYEWGPGSNNPGRYHSPAQAREQDKRCLEVYKPHPQLRVVPSSSNFEEKVDSALTFLNDALHIDGLVGKRTRVPVSVGEIPIDVLELAQAFVATSTYLDEEMRHCMRKRSKISTQWWQEKWQSSQRAPATALRTPGSWEIPGSPQAEFDSGLYEKRIQVTPKDGKAYLTRRIISEIEYNSELDLAKSAAVQKFGLSFILDHQYYELFFFSHGGPVVLDKADTAPTPAWAKPAVDTAGASGVPIWAPSPATSGAPMPGAQKDLTAVPVRTLSGRVLVRHTTEEAAATLAAKGSVVMH